MSPKKILAYICEVGRSICQKGQKIKFFVINLVAVLTMDFPATFLVLWGNVDWMIYNSMLAGIPYVFSIFLFRQKQRISPIWILGVFLFILFLPNAPYVVTDIIHFPKDYLVTTSLVGLLLLIAQYCAFFLLGGYFFGASYFRFESFVGKRLKLSPLVLRVPVFILVATGMYLGRVLRFNSWDVIFRLRFLLFQISTINKPQAVVYILGFSALLFVFYTAYSVFRTKHRPSW